MSRIDLGLTQAPTQTTSAPRATDPTSGQQFRAALVRTTAGALAGVERMLPFVPGGVAVSAAIRGASATGTGTGLGGAVGNVSPSATTAGSNVVQDSADQALELIALQQQIGLEQRQFTTVSNVMKARHDTVKNLIGYY